MERLKKHIIFAFLLLMSLAAHAEQTADDVTIEDMVEDSLATVAEGGEAVSVSEVVAKELAAVGVEEMTDSVAQQPVVRSDNYWKEQLFKGKLNLYDESIKYPKFLQKCVELYRWGDRTFNSYDSDYVVGTGYKCKLFVKNEEWLDSYAMRFPQKSNLGMMSNVSSNIGGYVQYMAVSVGYSREINALFGTKVSGQNKFEFQFTCSLFSAEVYYTKNTGSTNIHHLCNYNGGKWFTQEFNGLSSESVGADIYYFFNNKKYSQGAAYNFSKYQKKSAGSWIAGLTLSHQNIGLDFSELSDDMKLYLPGVREQYRFKYNDYCFLLGYGYNWVFKKNWLFNVSFLPSVGFKHCLGANVDGRGDLFSLNLKGKLGLVYNHKRFFYGLGMRADGHWYRSRDYGFFNSIESLTLTAGFRFDIF